MVRPDGDPLTGKNGSGSPMKSLSWSEQTVAQVDDRCVQITVDEFILLLPNDSKDIDDKQWKKLSPRSFRGADIRNLPDSSESKMYIPLCNILNAVERLAGSRYRWKVVANHVESRDVDHRPDLARYPINIDDAKLAYTRDMEKYDAEIARCAWAWMCSLIEVKNADDKAAFHFRSCRDKDGIQKFLRDSDVGKKARAQFIKFYIEAALRQHRTHFYTFYIADMYVRVFRWDRVGCIASEPIDLEKNPRQFLNILYRLATSSEDYGADDTVFCASEEDVSEVEAYDPGDNQYFKDYKDMMLDDQLSYPIYKVSCPTVSLDEAHSANGEEREYLIGRYAFGHYSPMGRCTRGYAAFDMKTKRLAWLKDQWRCAARPHTELDAYIRLHKHNVPFIATPVSGGDLDSHYTVSQKYMTHLSEDWRPGKRVHTRLVTKEVGRLLETYKNSIELVSVCGQAFKAHRSAYEDANILHRDVSIGNIMINAETGKGFLNDWDLCKYREDLDNMVPASEPAGISGTWAFKSALSLRYPRKPPSVADDVESFVYVVLFYAFRFHHHELSPAPENSSEEACIEANVENVPLMNRIYVFFYLQMQVGGGYYKGGADKYYAILRGEPPMTLRPLEDGRITLLGDFLSRAYKLLSEHYWALDQADLEQWDVKPGDHVSPDEAGAAQQARGKQLADAELAKIAEETENQLSSYLDDMGKDHANDVRRPEDEAEARLRRAQGMPCPFRDPQRVLDTHEEMSRIFYHIFFESGGVRIDVSPFLVDKRYDQFLSWKQLCFLDQRGPTGKPLRKALLDLSREREKRKRSEDDEPENVQDDVPPPPKKKASAAKASEPKVKKAAKPSASSTRKRVPVPKVADPKKTTRKVPAPRKAAAGRKPASPRRGDAVKAEATGRSRSSKSAKAVQPVAATRRSTRLAAKDAGR
ncbi:hypothetical protein PsYK624_026670 [Phanerochaete sordida]|uniref:Fungal-type protein kinase domain-containing protein n=1 Tax=Phanerochaete sordida TaxID=48140 RepID=A0A9P3G0A1_9APHY|nr:hypothetical protein PsYK624_026670 [Phanerochaete sordida]